MSTEMMPGPEFTELAMRILDLHAHPDIFGRTYDDGTVNIQEKRFGLDLIVIRLAKEVDEPAMRRPVVTTIVDETGAIIRHHDEHAKLVAHMKTLGEATIVGDHR